MYKFYDLPGRLREQLQSYLQDGTLYTATAAFFLLAILICITLKIYELLMNIGREMLYRYHHRRRLHHGRLIVLR